MLNIFRRGARRDKAWDGVVTGRKRAAPDGQTVVFRITVSLSDGRTREVRVRRALYKTLEVGDHVTKRSGHPEPRHRAALERRPQPVRGVAGR
jgi:hypothetical protein